MIDKKMSKREVVQRIIDDGHLVITGEETLDDYREAFGWLVQGHECRNPPHLYSSPESIGLAIQRSRKRGTHHDRSSA